jgi:two-component system sensor histidine kinase AlgZ
MISIESFSLYVLLCILAPLVGAFTLAFIMIFESRFDLLQHETVKLELQKELQYAHYYQLNQQIKPHFFFNTLNTMLSLARLDRKQDLIKGLELMSKFLKYKYRTNDFLVPLVGELEYTNSYLEIQRLRFGKRIQVNQNIHPNSKKAFTPPFILQTIVENAFKHGFEKFAGPAVLTINIFENKGSLHIEVWNTHLQEAFDYRKNDDLEDDGQGMKNIQNRLNLMFPEAQIVFAMSHIENETLVKIIFPYRESNPIH